MWIQEEAWCVVKWHLHNPRFEDEINIGLFMQLLKRQQLRACPKMSEDSFKGVLIL